MKQKRGLWVSLLVTLAIGVVALAATVGASWSPKLGLDLDGGLSVIYQTVKPATSSQLSTAANILNERITGNGTSGATVATQGNNEITVSIPGEKDPQKILSQLGKTAQLYFRPALCYAPAYKAPAKPTATPPVTPTSCAASSQLTPANLQWQLAPNNINGFTAQGQPPPDPAFTSIPTVNPDNETAAQTVVMSYPSLLGSGPTALRMVGGPSPVTGAEISSASAQLVNNTTWAVDMTLNSKGSTAWDTLAQQQLHEPIAVELDGQVLSDPITDASSANFQSFGGQVQITGGFTESQAKQLANELNYGALPVALRQLTVQTVSPTLGKASLDAGLVAGLAGLLVVMIYMIAYYRMLGLVVVSGLALTGALLWAIVATLGHTSGTTLDLAGIIGIIVSIGITVDSYIVYFERLKDETRSGRTIRTSVDRGFQSAYRTVLAADAVSFLGAAVLYLLSIGPVRGFALFLGISTLLDVAVTYFFTRPFVVLLGRHSGATEARRLGVARGLGVEGAGSK